MNDEQPNSGPILRLFQVRAKPGCAAELIEKFRVTSAEVVRGYPGNLGYFFGHGVEADEELCRLHVGLEKSRRCEGAIWRHMEGVLSSPRI